MGFFWLAPNLIIILLATLINELLVLKILNTSPQMTFFDDLHTNYGDSVVGYLFNSSTSLPKVASETWYVDSHLSNEAH
ncbi:hypothetical protein BJ875DRAFT_472295 [Amylocarpus encephaloides]|uniref:Uncharacterized protein n=1 Tax=Amylocarpus encephaloides TaxID=45428 RepID=A0A9P7YB26_9HELO|nr:hypothetical protein BJ875DRAFT_472295 [Amylocarpus encephaloides]